MNTKNLNKSLVTSGLLIAISIVLTRLFSFTIPIMGFSASRLGIGYVPIMMAGIILGPVWGLAVGAVADILGFIVSNSGGSVPYSPFITITSMLFGLFPYILMRLFKRLGDIPKLIISISITAIVCSLFYQTYVLSKLMNAPYWGLLIGRMPMILAVIPVYCIILNYVLKGLKRAKLYNP